MFILKQNSVKVYLGGGHASRVCAFQKNTSSRFICLEGVFFYSLKGSLNFHDLKV